MAQLNPQLDPDWLPPSSLSGRLRSQRTSVQNPYDIPLYWLVYRDPYNALLYPNPLYKTTNRAPLNTAHLDNHSCPWIDFDVQKFDHKMELPKPEKKSMAGRGLP